ncbi:MAG: bifunctional demethylmenaquinone methyltransferase/2-methoxy-6-polyprenyl-1,4-benzoquinol methylase UbiE [Bacteriovoracales bacterium]|nr:bifunctional demethylmenaquinone methyltransferase/2-methoxy-6-polyprenyl-1,4-benzoquinol methylase UbiE [Bacteriovoracales bacterium]
MLPFQQKLAILHVFMDRPIQIEKKDSWKLFDQIAGTYDRLNTLISFGIDRLWRQKMMQAIKVEGGRGTGLKALDLASGTGEVALLLAAREDVAHVYGIDLSQKMMDLAGLKASRLGLGKKLSFSLEDAGSPPYPDGHFDLITLAFGIRNVQNVSHCLSHAHRLLKPKGQILILEFGLPRTLFLQKLYLFYLRTILPAVGKALSKHPFAYSYLNRTVESFPYGNEFEKLLISHGFKSTYAKPFSFGVAYLYSGRK